MSSDGKAKFYRTLNLDKELWQTIKEFNKIKKEMINETSKRKIRKRKK